MSKNDFNETKMKRHSDERMDGRTDGRNLSSTRRQWKSKRYETNLDTTQHSQIPTHTHAAAMKFDTMRVRHLECKRRGGGGGAGAEGHRTRGRPKKFPFNNIGRMFLGIFTK